ncbi:MAG TPA: carbonic anhydrase [Woeseiaceae bacterium]|nr:carbonic anhydrase [Woeseiaceae bacterium]
MAGVEYSVSPDALAALAALREGNRRFVQSETTLKITDADRRNAVDGQNPVAVVLGCSDSRVPTEVVFDQGVGELFVIRVAGNIVQPSQIGSVEFAAQNFGTRLVVVLGHTHCGAIAATVDELKRPAESQSRNIASIVSRIRPSVEDLLGTVADREELLRQAVRANVCYSANALRHGSDIIESLVRDEGLLIVGAEYSLTTGVVDFFDGVPGD